MTADTIGGVWTYAMTLCESLQNQGIEIHLATLGRPISDHQNKQLEKLENVILYESNFKLEWMEDPGDDVQATAFWIGEIYEKVQPDLLHFNNYVKISDRWNCPKITVFHSCVATWFEAVKGEKIPESWQKYMQHLNKALQASDCIVFPSNGIKNLAEKVHGQIENSVVIYNGANFTYNKIPKKQHYILTAGRIWDKAKNISLLRKVAASLSWPLKIAGSNAEYVHDRAINIHYLGELPHEKVCEYMGRAAVFASSALYEPFGLAVLEAAYSGCALALSDNQVFKEIWGDAATYFDPNDEAEARAAIQLLIDDEALRKKMAEKAKGRASEFTAVKMSANYFSLYLNMLHEKPQLITLNTIK